MKLDSFILRHGNAQDMLGIGLSTPEINLVESLPPLLRARLLFIRSSERWFGKPEPYFIIIFADDTFISSPVTRIVVPYYLPEYNELKILFWQASIYLKTGFWLEPSKNNAMSIDLPDSIRTRAKMACLVAFAPMLFPIVVSYDFIRRHSLALVEWISSKF